MFNRISISILVVWMLLTGCRSLVPNEQNFLSNIYSGQLNFSKIWVHSVAARSSLTKERVKETLEFELRETDTITTFGMDRAELLERSTEALLRIPGGVTIKNDIYFSKRAYQTDFAAGFPTEVNFSDLGLMAHEVMHVWQHQNRKRTGYSLLVVASEHLRYRDPYQYTIVNGKKFLKYRFEQQAQMVQDYVVLSYFPKDPAKLREITALLEQELDLTDFMSVLREAINDR